MRIAAVGCSIAIDKLLRESRKAIDDLELCNYVSADLPMGEREYTLRLDGSPFTTPTVIFSTFPNASTL